MSTMDNEEKPPRLTGKEADLFFGLKVTGLLFLIVASGVNITAALWIDYFAHWYAVDLPGMPLPALTLLVVHSGTFLGWLSIIWPLLGLATLFIRERIRLAMVLLAAVVMVSLVQATLTAVALSLPAITLPTGISKDHP
jgi:hypothetical protein